MILVGRENERSMLLNAYSSFKPEFAVVYGRRRVGKTYLVDATFDGKYSFRHSALPPATDDRQSEMSPLQRQLTHFYYSLLSFGLKPTKKPKNWAEAFYLLETLLSKKENERLVIFLDELPWFDTPKSDFVSHFVGFWNNWACFHNVLLIVSGSSISWITNKIFLDHGGLYGRPTLRIGLLPFTLKETERFLIQKGIVLSRYDIALAYIYFGGIPYYLDILQPGLSLPQSIDQAFFAENAPLRNEFDNLFKASFGRPEAIRDIVLALNTRRDGLTRDEILKQIGKEDGGTFSENIKSLEQANFVSSYKRLGEADKRYRLIDAFSKFALLFQEGLETHDEHYFSNNSNSGSLNALKGYGFENLCFSHVPQIKFALGISGVACSAYSYSLKKDGAQIDMVLQRKDNIVNLCEMKFTTEPYRLSKEDEESTHQKVSAIEKLIPDSSAVHPVLVTTYPVGSSRYQSLFVKIITLDDLFAI